MGLDLLFKDDPPMLAQLLASGILHPCGQLDETTRAELGRIKWPHNFNEKAEALLFQNSKLNKIFGDIVYVIVTMTPPSAVVPVCRT